MSDIIGQEEFFYKDYKIKNLTILNEEEKKMALQWRNDENVRKWMVNKDIITYTEHLNYLDSLKNKTDKLCFLIQENDDYLGIVEFDEIDDNQAYLGLNINPLLFGKGIGKKLCELSTYVASKKLHIKKLLLFVYTENIKAIKLYKKCEFKITKESNVNNKNIFYMEKSL